MKHLLKVSISWDSYTPDCLIGFLGVPIVYDSFDHACVVATVLFERFVHWLKTDNSCDREPVITTEVKCKWTSDVDIVFGDDDYIDPFEYYRSNKNSRIIYWLCNVLDDNDSIVAWLKIEIEKVEANKDVN